MDPLGLLVRELRRDTPAMNAARAAIKRALALRLPPNAIHRALLAERQLRQLVTGELSRALYWQPLFELLCDEVGEGCRLVLAPDSKLPAIDGCRLRLADRVQLSARTTFIGAKNGGRPVISIGEGTWIGDRCILRAGLGIEVGARVLFANSVTLAGDPGHPLDPVRRRTEAAPRESLGHLRVGDDVWLAEGCMVVGSVTIGEGAVVAARSVVTKDVPPRTVVAGMPAKVVRELDAPAAPVKVA